ncbi:type ISP restriction/modification enzyme [uncultured Varibaculum sp.]|uniref:DEAD/DEAH box helicase n=1 Tax=uncultured Varibaculum sp. TaxID=413896 RepID=UPI00259899BE|nr:type ISP restriction/modification enzyme [uncultured Varibaculum sp.]
MNTDIFSEQAAPKGEGNSASDSLNAVDTQQEAARSVAAFDALLTEYREIADSERNKGNLFEQLIRSYLLNDSQMGPQFGAVYLWRDWPGGGLAGKPDTGIDLVAIETEDMPADGSEPTENTPAVAIQCKFYRQGHTIQKGNLDSFLSDSGKEPFTRRIFVETTGVPWSDNAETAIEGQSKPVTRIGLTDLRNSNIDWTTYSFNSPDDAPQHRQPKILRDHQVNAINDVFEGFKSHDRGTLVMACGTGKTFTSLKIAEQLTDDLGGNARIMFMVPSLSLMSQTLSEWASEVQVPFSAWSVCSDTKVNRKRRKHEDLVDIATVDLKTPPTTDAKKLADSLLKHQDDEGLQVVFCTYQSIDIVHQAQELAGKQWRDFDLIICDEAHRTTGVTLSGEDESAFTRVHDNTYLRAEKRLYMTATPRIFQPRVKNVAKENDAILASMDDESLYGKMFHRLGFGQAVSLGLLTDYKVVVLAIPEDQITQFFQQDLPEGELTIPEAAKLVGCWNALAKRKNDLFDVQYGEDKSPMRRAVAFAKDIKTSKQITAEFPELVRTHLQDLSNTDESDNLEVQCKHVDGSMNAIERGEALDWLKSETSDDHPVCRILTNARCLSEGVDVPTLDAVLFLNPRRSQVDVIQAVGRVMRKAKGKEFGYIILPVAVPVGTEPEKAMDDNKRFAVVWQVLQAIRAHDERFDSTINAIEYNENPPENIMVEVVNLAQSKERGSGSTTDIEGTEVGTGDGIPVDDAVSGVQAMLNIPSSEWKDAVYSKIVKKVGNRLYWDDWSQGIADIASRYINLIDHLLEDPLNQDYFAKFVESLQTTLNPAIKQADAVEMLAQHLITKPLFDAMFPDQDFTAQNPVSQAMQAILDRLATNQVFENEREPLAKFYATMAEKITAIDNLAGKQEIMRTLYDRFFSKAFPTIKARLGIVFTPVPVVDYILKSAEYAMQKHFGKSLGDSGVSIIDPFLGTGTFVSRLLQSEIIPPEQLEHKYLHEIFANEIVLLSYYIASINIEQVYHQIQANRGQNQGYLEFPGITLTDTFQLREGEGQLAGIGDFQANLDRVKRQREAPIRVVVMNPPYSVGQKSANDKKKKFEYPQLDARIKQTYAASSQATNNNSLYDSYFRALRWASDRIGEEGIIAFVSNNSFIDGITADGVRLSWAEEFSDIYVYNLRGSIRGKLGEAADQEGGNVFPIMTGVAITILVKAKDASSRPCRIHYAEVDDYLVRQEKLDLLKREASVAGTEFEKIIPNAHGDWINQRDKNYLKFQEIGDKRTKGKSDTPGVFQKYSRGLATSRDAWCYNFSRQAVESNMQRMIDNYNGEVAHRHTSKDCLSDKTQISWNRQLYKDLDRGVQHKFIPSVLQASMYRPFCKQTVYFERSMNDMIYQLPQIFPSPKQPNLGITLPSGPSAQFFMPILYEKLPALTPNGGNQMFPLYTWEKTEKTEDDNSLFASTGNWKDFDTPEEFSGSFDFNKPIGSQVPSEIDGYCRRENITDTTLSSYRRHYQDKAISKEDIFFYIYALLHHPQFRERYEADLKKMLPRIPKVQDFWSYANIGRELAELHVNYEEVAPYPGVTAKTSLIAPDDDWQKYHLKQLTWGKIPGKRDKDYTTLMYNEYLTFTGIPEQANEYKIGGRSPLEWMVDRYRIKTDTKSGIVNDPNDYCREVNDPAYIANLIPALVTVSMRTLELTRALPEFIIDEEQ